MKYSVYVPICGYAYIEVEAENEEAAIDEAFKQGCSFEDVIEFDMYKRIVEGNVFNGMMNEIDIIPVEE